MKITIPTRDSAPSTNLFIDICKSTTDDALSPYLFILPGGPGAYSTHYQSYKVLANKANVILHDPRGCGQSDEGDPNTYTLDNYVDDVESIRLALGLNEIIVLGKSYGGIGAIAYALRYPQAVKKLIIVASSPSYHLLEKAREKVNTIGTVAQRNAYAKLLQGNFTSDEEVADYFETMAPLYAKSIKTSKDDAVNDVKPLSFAPLNLGFSTFLRTYDYTDQLKNIICPSLVLAGEDDWICDVSFSKLMAQEIPHARLEIFEKASHLLELDVKEAYFGAIEDFIEN